MNPSRAPRWYYLHQQRGGSTACHCEAVPDMRETRSLLAKVGLIPVGLAAYWQGEVQQLPLVYAGLSHWDSRIKGFLFKSLR